MLLAVLNASFFAIVLLVLGVPYWLPLAIWTGLVSEFIPTVGTYLGIGLPALVALANQPSDALWVVVFGTLYQQLENYLIAPRITARTVHMHPAVALGAVIVGATLFGALGALVAIPVVAAIQSVIETYGRRYDIVADVEAQPVDEHPPVPRPRWPRRASR
jgi:predicted PurR-regulated permease PerM